MRFFLHPNKLFAIVVFSFAVTMSLSSCMSSKKIKIPTKEEVDRIRDDYDHAGQDLKPRQKKVFERRLNKIDDIRVKEIRMKQAKAEKGKSMSAKEIDKLYRKQAKQTIKLQKYHRHINVQRQSPEVRRRMNKHRREANRRARKRRR